MTAPRDDAAALGNILAAQPELSDFGFGTFYPKSRTPEQHAAQVARDRAALLAQPDGFRRARSWLAAQRRTKHVNPRAGSSYGLKHRAERDIGYTTNGAFIAAAIAEGYIVQRCSPHSPNAWINISTRAGFFPGS